MQMETLHYTFTLTEKEVAVWMASLRAASRSAAKGVQMFPWDSCPFLRQHADLSELTGRDKIAHEDLESDILAIVMSPPEPS